MTTDDRPRAFFDGRVLHDPDGLAIVKAVERFNCLVMLREIHRERVVYFTRRMVERGLTPRDVVIVVINVDAPLGAELAELLMPGHDWNAIRARGETPYARGLAMRRGMEELCAAADKDVGAELAAIDGLAVVVVDRGIIAAFKVSEVVFE